jgi:hypothetical protein
LRRENPNIIKNKNKKKAKKKYALWAEYTLREVWLYFTSTINERNTNTKRLNLWKRLTIQHNARIETSIETRIETRSETRIETKNETRIETRIESRIETVN